MKRLLLIAAAFSMTGCAALPAITGIVTQATAIDTGKVVVPATQALIVAHNAYQGAAATATAAINACSITPTLAPCVALKAKLPQIAALSDKAKSLLDQADKGINVAANAAEVMNIVATMKSLSGR